MPWFGSVEGMSPRLDNSTRRVIGRLSTWGTPESALELTAELGRAAVPDRGGRPLRADPFPHHDLPRAVEPNLLHVLERGQRRHRLERIVEGRCAHVGGPSQLGDLDRSVVLGVDELEGPRHLVQPSVAETDPAEELPLRTGQDTVEDLPNDRGCEDPAVRLRIEAGQQTVRGIEELIRGLGHRDAPDRLTRTGGRWVGFRRDLGERARIDAYGEGEKGRFRRCVRDLRVDG